MAKFECSNCKLKLKTKRSLKYHECGGVPDDEKPFQCAACGKGFVRKRGLSLHTAMVHSGDRKSEASKYVCSVCLKRLSKTSHLEEHMRIHTGERPFACPLCERRFPRRQTMNEHLARWHTREKPHLCNVCKKDFVSLTELKVHHARNHTGEAPYSCIFCDKRFKRISSYNCHIRAHTGERPFACSTCDKTFMTKSNLNLYWKMHSECRPFSCDQCGLTFWRKKDVLEHRSLCDLPGPSSSNATSSRQEDDKDIGVVGEIEPSIPILSVNGEKDESLNSSGRAEDVILPSSSPERPSSSSSPADPSTSISNAEQNLGIGIDLLLERVPESGLQKPKFAKEGMKITEADSTHDQRPYSCNQCSGAFSNCEDLRRHLLIHTVEGLLKKGLSGDVVVAVLTILGLGQAD